MNDSSPLIVPIKHGKPDAVGENVIGILIDHVSYVIYITRESGVRWTTNDPNLPPLLAPIFGLLSQVMALQTGKLSRDQSLNKQIGLSIHQAFNGHEGQARAILRQVRKRLLRIRAATSRLRYWLSALASTLLLGIGLASVLIFTPQVPSDLQVGMGVLFAGSVGALLSVALGLNNVQADPDDPLAITLALASSRIIIGVIGAAFAYVLVQADVLLGFVQAGSVYGSLVIGFLAGFSETLVPNILKKLDSQIETVSGNSDNVKRPSHTVRGFTIPPAAEPAGETATTAD
jgi:hypothetical protein